MMHASRIGGRAARVRRALLIGKDRDQPAVTGIEIEMTLGSVVEIGLLEHERHPEDALPEIDRGLSVRAHQRDVVHSLALQLLHGMEATRSAGSGVESPRRLWRPSSAPFLRPHLVLGESTPSEGGVVSTLGWLSG